MISFQFAFTSYSIRRTDVSDGRLNRANRSRTGANTFSIGSGFAARFTNTNPCHSPTAAECSG